MSTKRILAAILGIFMVVALAVPAFAYSTPYAELQTKSFYTSKLTVSGSNSFFDLFGSTTCTPATKTAAISLTDATGAWHLTNTGSSNTGYATGAKGLTSSNVYSQFVDNTVGMTFDMYAKFVELPTLETNDIMTDEGAPSLNPSNLYFAGLVFNLCSAEKYMADTTKSNNEMQAVFATYYNDELGTDSVLILPYGNRNAWASNSAAVTYFFDMPTEYARFTLTFDAARGTTQFFIDGEAQVAAGDDSDVHDGIALSYRATATSNFLNINLNNAQVAVANGGTGTDFYLDQINVYPNALTPAEDFLFNEEPNDVSNANFTNAYNYYRDFAPMADEYFNPTFWDAFEGWINYGLDLIDAQDQEALNAHADSGVNGTWFINRFHFKSTAGINATTGGSAATVNGTGTVIPAATPVLLNYDRLYVSHADYDGTNAAWSNSSNIITKPGVNVYDVMSFGGALGGTGSTWRAYICEPTEVEDYYKVINLGGNTSATRPVIPEGGFAILFHVNGKTNTTCNTASFEYNKYNSGLFWARNVHGVYAAGISNGGYVKATGITLNDGAAATLDTEGAWLTYKDPALNGGAGDHVYRTGYVALGAADAEGRTTATRDAFVGFKSNAYIQGVAELPEPPVVKAPITVTVNGNGSVAATVNGEAVELSALEAAAGDVVTLTASGEGFKYWVGGNDAILGTDATITIPGGKALNIIAVFDDAAESETYNVYFKDSKTGKIVDVKAVAAGTVLTYDDVTAPSLKGYTFAGWQVAGGVDEGFIVNATTEVYASYVKDEATAANLTIVDGSDVKTVVRTYASIATVGTNGAGFSYWTLNGKIVSTDRQFTFLMPSADCTLEAVYGQTAPAAVASVVDLSKDGQTFYFMMSRSGDVKETGVLMTRKATAADLVVDTTVNTVTKGISTAAADRDVVGFQKDATGKTGTWLVRGYVILNDNSVVYTDVASIVID
ncbi:MAG: hypothetical protein IJF24_00905 [Clostridia bacterium]|nr:hypothetical protein [Clostridia bacterium]